MQTVNIGQILGKNWLHSFQFRFAWRASKTWIVNSQYLSYSLLYMQLTGRSAFLYYHWRKRNFFKQYMLGLHPSLLTVSFHLHFWFYRRALSASPYRISLFPLVRAAVCKSWWVFSPASVPVLLFAVDVAVGSSLFKKPIRGFICYRPDLLKIDLNWLGTLRMLFAFKACFMQKTVVICLHCKHTRSKEKLDKKKQL